MNPDPKHIAIILDGNRRYARRHHLELMKGYVSKTARGEFSATEKGLAVFKDSIKRDMSSKVPMGLSRTYAFFSLMSSRPIISLPISTAIGALEFALCYFFYFQPYLLGYSRSIATDILPYYYIGNVAILFIILEAFSYLITKRTGGELSLLNGIMLSRLPLVFLMLDPIIQATAMLAVVVLALGQLVSIYMLSTALSFSKGIRQELTIIICLMILYINLVIFSLA